MEREPKIIAFCCNWCAYAAADLAGSLKMKYSGNVRIIRVMCSGMVNPQLVLDALTGGADGVMVLGCHLGECHYIDGNEKARARSEIITELLDDMGYEKERFGIYWLSAAEPSEFVAAVDEMSVQVARLDDVSGR